ncbi:MAG: CorA family divalent cation transporter [Myxococcota bacterium]
MFTIREFNFDTKHEGPVELEGAVTAIKEGRFVWLDMDVRDQDPARAHHAMVQCGVPDAIARDALADEPGGKLNVGAAALHLVITGGKLTGEKLTLQRMDVIFTTNVMVTVHRGEVDTFNRIRAVYRDDFIKFAKGPSFLVFELWTHFLSSVAALVNEFSDRVDDASAALEGDVNVETFARIRALSKAVLTMHKHVVPARDALDTMSTRKMVFVNEATQGFLLNMVKTLERTMEDLMTCREVLEDSLDLYMSLVGFKTNQVMSKLTVVTFASLPLFVISSVASVVGFGADEATRAPFLGTLGVATIFILFLMRHWKLI